MMFLNKKYLKDECQPVTFDKPQANEYLANQMVTFVRKKNALGLAANQVGKNVRLFVMVIDGKVYKCFNPEILGVSENKVIIPEGCLSFPGEFISIDRPRTISVEYYSSNGEKTLETLSGMEARCFMHEYDHLNGITMHERFNDAA